MAPTKKKKKVPTSSSTAFSDALNKARFYRRRVFITFLLVIPFMETANWLTARWGLKNSDFIAFLICGAIYLFSIFSMAACRCPNCHETFFVQKWLGGLLVYANPFAWRCIHCGQRLNG